MQTSVDISRDTAGNVSRVALWQWPALILRFAKFCTVGLSGVGVNMLALFLLHGLAGLPIIVAAPLAIEIAIANNFLWNDVWTFARRSPSARRFLKFNLVALGGLAINVAILETIIHQAGWHYLLANGFGIAAATGWNFSLSVLWTWRAR